MFSDQKKGKMAATESYSQQNLIAKGTTITGDIVSEGDFRIEGNIKGNLKTPGKVVIGKTGHVQGKVESNIAEIEGSFSGSLEVNNILTLKSTAVISGEVIVNKLSVEPGAEFNATCSMKGSVKKLDNEKSEEEKSAS